MKKVLRALALLCLLTASACGSTPKQGGGANLSPAQAKASVEEIISFYAISAKEMHIKIDGGGTVMRWQDQLHDAQNRMTWVPRKHKIDAADTLSATYRDKNAVAMKLSGKDGEAVFYAENEERAQQLANALRSLIKHAQ